MKIDVKFTSNIQFKSIKSCKVSNNKINEETKRADVYFEKRSFKAIGRGHNIRLAGLLTGYELDVIPVKAGATADDDDVELTEFSDEIEEWVIEEFAKIGLDTAKNILKM
jgi:N utilization substance protein A